MSRRSKAYVLSLDAEGTDVGANVGDFTAFGIVAMTNIESRMGKKETAKPQDKGTKTLRDMFAYIHNNILAMNQSKLFAGLVIIILNISSKFVNIKLSKSIEGYLKHTFSRDILVFAMAWMGTRDIYTALFITLVFSICVNFLFNEQSGFCCLSESFIETQSGLLEEEAPKITEQQISDAVALLANAKKQKEADTSSSSSSAKK